MATIILEKSAYKTNSENNLNLSNNTSSEITTIYGAGIKKTVVLKFRNDGTLINPQPIDIGRVNDNKVTNLYFDLDELIWNKFHIYKKHTPESIGKQIDEIEDLFNFYLLVSPVDSSEEPQRYKFFKRNFEIPRILTKQNGILKAVVVVSEKTDEYTGNIPESSEYKEVFVSKQFNLHVNSSIYDCEQLDPRQFETAQRDSLVKPSLFATLSDNGDFNLYTDSTLTTLANNGGQKLDSFVTYVLFDGFNVTNNLKSFNNFLFFKKDKEYYYSPFQRTSNIEEHDDIRTNFIAWIPPQVSQESGEWKICIISYNEDISKIPFKNEKGEWGKINKEKGWEGITEPYSSDNSKYNFYVSSDVTINIESNFLINSINSYSTWNSEDETDDTKVLSTNAIYWTTDVNENSLIHNKQSLSYDETKELFDKLKVLSGKTITTIPGNRDNSFYITGTTPEYTIVYDWKEIEKTQYDNYISTGAKKYEVTDLSSIDAPKEGNVAQLTQGTNITYYRYQDINIKDRTYFRLYTFEPISCSNETQEGTYLVIGNSNNDSYQDKNNSNELYEEKLSVTISKGKDPEQKEIYCYTSLIKYSSGTPTGGLYDLSNPTFNLYIWKQGGNA